MPRGPGRDQLAPMERVIRLISALVSAPGAVATEDLVRVGGYRAGDAEDAKRMLARDIAQLNESGWDIRNVAPAGEAGRWQLHARDTRLRVRLSPAQRAELVRAAVAAGRPSLVGPLDPGSDARSAPAVLAGRADLVEDDPATGRALAAALRAVARHCRVRFTYKDVARQAHPWAVHPGPSGWYLRAREEGSRTVKEFVLDRVRDLVLDRPGTAEVPPRSPRPELDPLRWEVDPPLSATVLTTPEHRAQVEHLLGPPVQVDSPGGADGGTVRLVYRVTHRGPFRWRLYELGGRVRLQGPDLLRRELLAELTATVDAAP